MFVSLINYCSSSSLFHCSFVVCKDGSCSGGSDVCYDAEIDYVVGPSCTDVASCLGAEIGSVDLSCKDEDSCRGAQLGGVDLINSCNKDSSCKDTDVNGVGVFDELIDCCNDIDEQCKDKEGLGIVNAGCVSYMCTVLLLLLIVSLFVKWLTLLSFTC